VLEFEYADATNSVHDLLGDFKQHPLVKDILEGGERLHWGTTALPGGGYRSMPKLSMPGGLLAAAYGPEVEVGRWQSEEDPATSPRGEVLPIGRTA